MDVEICRLCLKPICDGNFDAINNIWKQMLNVLLLKLDLTISKDPVMCNECMTFLQSCFNFKSICVSLETRSPSIKSEENDNLTLDVHSIQETMDLSDISNNQKICHFCMKQNQLGPFTTLNESTENMFLIDIIQKYIPEMNMDTTQEILACDTCFDSIQIFSTFVMHCLDVEDRIIKYIKMEGTSGRNYIELNKIQCTLPIIKHETSCADMNVNKMKDDSDIEQGVGMKIEIETEGIDINKLKSDVDEDLKIQEQNDCKRVLETTLLSGSYKEEYETYLSMDPSEKEFICEVCSFKAKDEQHINDHMLTHKKEKYQCNLCSYNTKIRRNLLVHILRHKNSSEVKMYRCDSCMFESKYSSVVKKHVLIHKNPSEIVMYRCEVCTYEAKRRDTLRKHVITHKAPSEVTLYKCNVCSFNVKRKENLKAHMLTHKDPSELIMYKCEKCAYVAKRKYSLKSHMLTHRNPSEIEMYKCDLCGLGIKHKKSLIKHMLIHRDTSEITVYNCEMCAYQTKYKSDLKKHIKAVHNGFQQLPQ